MLYSEEIAEYLVDQLVEALKYASHDEREHVVHKLGEKVCLKCGSMDGEYCRCEEEG